MNHDEENVDHPSVWTQGESKTI
jgi:hypothetical protein